MFADQTGMIVTGVIQQENGALGFGMARLTLVYQFLKGLGIHIRYAADIDVFTIERAVGPQDVVALTARVTADDPAVPFFRSDITQAHIVRRVPGIYKANPVVAAQRHFEFKISLDKGFLILFLAWVRTATQYALQFFQTVALGKQENPLDAFCNAPVALLFVLGLEF